MSWYTSIPWEGSHLPAAIQYPATRLGIHPAVIICHGFVGSKEGVDRLFVKAANELSASIVVRFDYDGCGESMGEYGLNTKDRFIAQTKAVIGFVKRLKGVDPESIALIGHSLGGAVALEAAIEEEVRHLALWSAVGSPRKDLGRIIGDEVEAAVLQDGKADYLGYELRRDFLTTLQGWDPIRRAGDYKGNVFLAHGDGDEEIPVDYCSLYHSGFSNRPSGKVEKIIIPNGTHTYSSSHAFQALLDSTRRWLLQVQDVGYDRATGL
ncbi:alpha/beta hydrolase [Rossellomorea marisflavi]|uniref:AB hydrolase-1 domain-containing protein n=1 Tax=Rossellomorea marisflavi TaxID=189381 RepID=A0A0J5V3H3_9BACI|nr:alpha/beta hydrolase [Rossellomorea marisflavi]KMK91909.1 hypothetical protein VL03_18300 [Rossellomorea marisflavi]KML34970.1 hypothetical protein VL12_02045 [Rossellomorea marisflavi]KZE53280.1 hypothetical protein AV649_10950 [Rossellomorea marisflavi]MCM2605085.1 alpha/beta hydrolase [Rossellomorea marisflavi]QHA37510.1 alpha/beta fold hydrolase [Rossellomorea marisflavi]